jgi:hypothetical protein
MHKLSKFGTELNISPVKRACVHRQDYSRVVGHLKLRFFTFQLPVAPSIAAACGSCLHRRPMRLHYLYE